MPTLTEQINTSLGDVNISVSIDGEVQKLVTIAETLVKLVDDQVGRILQAEHQAHQTQRWKGFVPADESDQGIDVANILSVHKIGAKHGAVESRTVLATLRCDPSAKWALPVRRSA